MAARTSVFPAEFEAFIAERVQSGRYENRGQVLVALKGALEREERYREKLAGLKLAIEEGEASGIAEGDVFARVRARAGLPPRVHA
jgi:putative addiction module CopG family antidote